MSLILLIQAEEDAQKVLKKQNTYFGKAEWFFDDCTIFFFKLFIKWRDETLTRIEQQYSLACLTLHKCVLIEKQQKSKKAKQSRRLQSNRQRREQTGNGVSEHVARRQRLKRQGGCLLLVTTKSAKGTKEEFFFKYILVKTGEQLHTHTHTHTNTHAHTHTQTHTHTKHIHKTHTKHTQNTYTLIFSFTKSDLHNVRACTIIEDAKWRNEIIFRRIKWI